MFKLENNAVKNSILSFTFFNLSNNFNKKEKNKILNLESTETIDRINFTESKTTLSTNQFHLIDNINDNVIVYLFIQKDKKSSAWNLIAPIVEEKRTGKIFQFALGYFALQGSGGGISNICSLFSHLRNLKERGFKVDILPKIADTSLINDFEYIDSGIKLQDLLNDSIDLINYRKEKFSEIYKEHIRLIEKHNLE
ncbi:hypothetical protein C8C83_0491 [Flavobacterium sp. 90]|uniref:hypothetical protein n=1 Tax=unclassified Flavobacterium TaxID=196869 RepID=UPI000EB29BCE|nr:MULTISPECIES: hypothetical protein [unclassified Flavobacterium]RKR08896.1 hypothetical protein C8C82_0786 [Flavobacterium sp. 81]TCK52684.1 hypothetical protein C8C83_0491 [Flavobacterium sp. 90]